MPCIFQHLKPLNITEQNIGGHFMLKCEAWFNTGNLYQYQVLGCLVKNTPFGFYIVAAAETMRRDIVKPVGVGEEARGLTHASRVSHEPGTPFKTTT